MLVYLFAAIVALPLVIRGGLPWIRRRPMSVAWALAIACLAGAALVFALLYPQAQARSAEGLGSDADDALNLAAGRLLAGQYPYAARTYLDHPISPMPGAVILAVPFCMLGNAAIQNSFWLIVYFAISAHVLGGVRLAALNLLLFLSFSIAIAHQHVVGIDWVSNAIYVMAAMHLVLTVDSGQRRWAGLLVALFLGVTLSSRANFLLLVPILFAALQARFGQAAALRQVGIGIMVALAITVPFYLFDPAGFSPAHTANKLRDFDRVIPFAGILIGAATLGLSLVLSFHASSRELVGAYRNCAFVLMVPVLAGFLLETIGATGGDHSFLSYGVFFAVFGSIAAFASIARTGRPIVSESDATDRGG